MRSGHTARDDTPEVFDYRTDPAIAELLAKAAELARSVGDLRFKVNDGEGQVKHAEDDLETAKSLAAVNELSAAELAQVQDRVEVAKQTLLRLKGELIMTERALDEIRGSQEMSEPALKARSRDSIHKAYWRLARKREELLQRLEALDAEMTQIFALAGEIFPAQALIRGEDGHMHTPPFPYRVNLVQLHDHEASHQGWRRRLAEAKQRFPEVAEV